jgi:TPR repeat protein
MVFGAVLCVVQVARAGQLEDGNAAHDRGDFANAITLWLPSNQGGAQAQYLLGTMYANGKGVAQATGKR